MSYVFNPFSGTFDVVTSNKVQQVPVETPNGAIVTFTLPSSDTYLSGSLQVWVNGMLQKSPNDYSEASTTTFIMVVAPLSSDILLIAYRIN